MTTASHGPVTGVWESLTPDIEATLTDLQRQVVQQVEMETRSIYDHAREFWPVAKLRSHDSRGSLGWQVEISDDAVKGTVRSAADYTRYITSAQIAIGGEMGFDAEADDRWWSYRFAKARTAEEYRALQQEREDSLAETGQRLVKLLNLRRYVRNKGGGKLTGKAAKNGAAVWLLLRWPEKAAGERLTASLGPILESTMRDNLE